MSNSVTHELDARRLLCPLPVIRVQQLIEELGEKAVGDKIRVVCTDPGVLYDIPAWAKVHGHKLIATQDEDYEYTVIIQIVQA
ncbi:MAG TPA: sulfurtransferase TusA family protein [Leucothrix sp.]|nr:sulfurtransferase TusA family protein [Leucothrix sp.]